MMYKKEEYNDMIDREDFIVRSGVRDVFIPNKPIDSIELFCGRQDEVERIVEGVNTGGLHILLYGDRGVGKTSLSKITCKMLLLDGTISNCHIKTCDSSDTFVTIVQKLFQDLGIKCILRSSDSWTLSFLWSLIKIGRGGNTEYVTSDNISSPSWVADKIAHLEGVFLIDEIDVLQNKSDKEKIAQLIKQLSDKNSKLKIFLVGISKTAGELISGHPSVQRCIKEVRLERMSDSELMDIIAKGEHRLQMQFSKEVKRVIVKSSAGFPYFTQLLSLKSAEESIAKESRDVTMSEFRIAVRRAVDDLEGSLKEKYNQAIIGNRIERNKKILLAAAVCGEDIFHAKELKQNYVKITHSDITQQELNNFLSPNIISEGYSTILRRVGKGVYVFNDPRMPSFIKLMNNYIEE